MMNARNKEKMRLFSSAFITHRSSLALGSEAWRVFEVFAALQLVIFAYFIGLIVDQHLKLTMLGGTIGLPNPGIGAYVLHELSLFPAQASTMATDI